MTRSGAPFQGANGEGKTDIPAISPHGPDAAWAGDPTVAKMNAAVAAANRLARCILTTFLEEAGTAFGPADPHSDVHGSAAATFTRRHCPG
jgi:hypothetical protein